MTCQQAAGVISRSADAPLSAADRAGLGVHTLFCGPCRRFRRQVLRLHAACEQLLGDEPELPGEGLSAEARARIAASLERP